MNNSPNTIGSPLTLVGELADVDPRGKERIFFKLGDRKLDRTACAARGGENGFKSAKGAVEVDLYALVYGKGANSADSVADKGLDLVKGEHFRFLPKGVLIL